MARQREQSLPKCRSGRVLADTLKRLRAGGLLLAASLGLCTGTFAQPPAPDPVTETTRTVQPGEEIFTVSGRKSVLHLRNLDTRVIELGNRIKVVDGFDQQVLAVTALSPYRIRVRGEQPGVTTVKLIDEFDNLYSVDVFIEPDTRELEAYLRRLFPGCSIEVVGIRDGVVLRGWVTEPSDIPEIMSVAEQFYEIVQPQLTVAGPTQVQLHVKVMEVQRTKIRDLGMNFLMVGEQYYISNAISGLAPLQNVTVPFGGPPNPTILPSALSNSDMSFAVAGNSDIFQGFLKLLQSEALAKILAEPTLVTTSGRPATLLNGGEFPVLVPQQFGNVTIEWREFGVRMEFVPIVLGNGRLRLDVAPEVSERDFSNAVSINGLVVPGITVRRVNTQVELGFGETLMIGGLISSRKQGTTQKIPFLGELPWIGAAFSRKSYTMGETELVILVTPQMVAPMAPHQVPQGGPGLQTDDPTDHELYIDGMLEVPKFGPDCPTCPPGQGLIVPTAMPPQGGIPATPPAITPTPVDGMPSLIEPASGVRGRNKVTPASGSVDPFRESAASANQSQPAVQVSSAPRTRPSVQNPNPTSAAAEANGQRTKAPILSSRKLPGMITPESKPPSEGR